MIIYLYNKMFIVKLDPQNEVPIQSFNLNQSNSSVLTNKNHRISIISKRDSFYSERNSDIQHGEQATNGYPNSFKQVITKVMRSICRRNNFFKTEENQHFVSVNHSQLPNSKAFHESQSLPLPNQNKKTIFQHSKLKIKGEGQFQNDSNLLRRRSKFKNMNKTSISFCNNKEFRKKIQFLRTKRYSLDGNSTNVLQKGKQNQLNLNNTRYCQGNFLKLTIQQSFKVDSFVPKITKKQNYKQIHDLLKGDIEIRKNKIDVSKKIFHKKMIQRQKNNHQVFLTQQSPSNHHQHKQRPNHSISKNTFEPWATFEDFNEEIFKNSKKHFY